MVLSRSALEEFLERPLRDSSRAKLFSDRALDWKLDEAGLDFLTQPRHRAQKVSILLGMKYPSYLFLLDCGGGKTWVCLNLFRKLRKLARVSRMLVLVPNIVNLDEWERQRDLHAYDCTIRLLDVSGSKERLAILQDRNASIVVATYAGFAKLCSEVIHNPGGKGHWQRNDKTIDSIAKLFDFLVLDECTSVRNQDSLFFRVVRRLRRKIVYCYGLTATPFDKDPIALWSQFFLIDHGYTLGESIGIFREAFFKKKETYWGGFEYEFKKPLMPALARRLAHCSVRFEGSECQDLPPAVGGLADPWMLLPVKLPAAQRPYYDAIEHELWDARGNFEMIDNAYTRMRMISSGWIGAKTDEGEKVEVIFEENPKLDVIIAKLHELSDRERVILVHWFNTSGRLIHDRLVKEKLRHEWIYGGTSSASKKRAMESFRGSDRTRVLLASTAISKGVNLQDAARYMLFFESPDSTIDRKQMELRIRRESEEGKTCFFYDAVCRGTVDEKILFAHKEGKRIHDVIIDRKGLE